MNFPLVNIANKKSLVILFGRSPNGDLIIKKIHDFQPYYFEKDSNGEFKGYDGEKLRKIIVNEPNEIRELRSESAYSADIPYCKRYIIDKIDNILLYSLKVYKIFRRKNKIFVWAYNGKGKFTFKDENYSKKYYNLMKDHLKNENLC